MVPFSVRNTIQRVKHWASASVNGQIKERHLLFIEQFLNSQTCYIRRHPYERETEYGVIALSASNNSTTSKHIGRIVQT